MTASRYGLADEILSRRDVDNQEETWFQLRREGITATDIAALTGNSARGDTPFTVYWKKVADLRQPANEQMNAGTAWQETALEMAFKRGGKLWPDRWVQIAKPGLLRNIETPWMLCSPDAIVHEEGHGWVPLEIKTSRYYEGFGTEGTDEIPRDYWCQVAWQAMVLGSHIGYCGVLMPDHQIRLFVIEKTADWDWMVSEAKTFRDEFLIPENPPMVVGTPAELRVMKRVSKLNPDKMVEADDELVTLIAELRHLRSTRSDYERLEKACQVRIFEKMGEAQAVVKNDDTLVVRNTIERKGYTVEPSKYQTLVLKKERKSEET